MHTLFSEAYFGGLNDTGVTMLLGLLHNLS